MVLKKNSINKRTMNREVLDSNILVLKSETLILLRFYLAFKRIIKFDNFDSISRTHWADTVVSLKALENDMVLRICKFDDNTKGVYSFKKFKREEIQKINLGLENNIMQFTKMIAKLKKERRHNKLAHLKNGEIDGEFEPRYDLKPAILKIVEIVDLLNEEIVEYKWRDGRYESSNLRTELLD